MCPTDHPSVRPTVCSAYAKMTGAPNHTRFPRTTHCLSFEASTHLKASILLIHVLIIRYSSKYQMDPGIPLPARTLLLAATSSPLSSSFVHIRSSNFFSYVFPSPLPVCPYYVQSRGATCFESFVKCFPRIPRAFGLPCSCLPPMHARGT